MGDSASKEEAVEVPFSSNPSPDECAKGVSPLDLWNFIKKYGEDLERDKQRMANKMMRFRINNSTTDELKEAVFGFLLSDDFKGIKMMLDNKIDMPQLFKNIDPKSEVYHNIYIRHPSDFELMNLIYLFPKGNTKKEKQKYLEDWDHFSLHGNPNYIPEHSAIKLKNPTSPPSTEYDMYATRRPGHPYSELEPLWYIEEHPEIPWIWTRGLYKEYEDTSYQGEPEFSYQGGISENPGVTVGFVLANLDKISFGRYGMSGNLFNKHESVAAEIKREKEAARDIFKGEEYVGPVTSTGGIADVIASYY